MQTEQTNPVTARILALAALVMGHWPGAVNLVAAEPGESVVVIYNRYSADSKSVAEHYAERRKVPPAQVLGLALPMTETMSRVEYRRQLEEPLLRWLEEKALFHYDPPPDASNGEAKPGDSPLLLPTAAKVRYAVLCFDVPLKIKPDTSLRETNLADLPEQLRRNEAAVDDELTLLPTRGPGVRLTGPTANRFYGTTNALELHPTNGVLMVTRLDGPTAAIARSLVDKAMEAETNGLWGRAYFDLRGIEEGDYKLGDDILGNGARVCTQWGFETVADVTEPTFSKGFPLSQIAVYAGWYTGDVNGPFTAGTVEFQTGAFAYHLHSFSANTLRTTSRHWCGPLLAKGATVTLGSVYEPYLGGTPDVATLLARWIGRGFTFGEAVLAGQRNLSWQTTTIGDPLYRPFAKPPEKLHEATIARGGSAVEWAHLRVVNLNLASGLRESQVLPYLEELPLTGKSAILQEKLGDLYAASGKPAAALRACDLAITLDPTPQQRIRLGLALGHRLAAADRVTDAVAAYERFLGEQPQFPDKAAIYEQMARWAEKAGRTVDAEKFRSESSRAAQ